MHGLVAEGNAILNAIHGTEMDVDAEQHVKRTRDQISEEANESNNQSQMLRFVPISSLAMAAADYFDDDDL